MSDETAVVPAEQLTAEVLVSMSAEEAKAVVQVLLEGAIANARSFDDLKRIGEQAEAFRRMFDAVGGFQEAQNECAYQKLLVQRTMGEMLPSIIQRGGDPNGHRVRLADLSIGEKDSQRWQQMASVPREAFETHVSEVREKGEDLTAAGVIRLARTLIGRPEKASVPALPDGQFSLILADPPWRYDFSIDSADAIENHYPTLDIDQLCDIPVEAMAAPDCVLFLWATSPKLVEAIRLVSAWGFTYKTFMVWHKSGLGMGYYARQNHEPLLIATRGQPGVPLPENRPNSVIHAEKGCHSAKPEVFRETIERMYPSAKRIELFCRSPRPGWAVWGNEVDSAA